MQQLPYIRSIEKPTSRAGLLWFLLFEGALTAGIAYLLYIQASPLLVPKLIASTSDGRYVVPGIGLSSMSSMASYMLHEMTQSISRDMRATALFQYSSYWLCIFSGLGWIGITLARFQTVRTSGFILMIWFAMAWIVRPFGLPGMVWVVGILLGVTIAAAARNRNVAQAAIPNVTVPTLWAMWIWPGWVLFTGLGWLWIADFAAHGPVSNASGSAKVGARYFGLYQADALWLANGILLYSSLWRRYLVTATIRICVGLDNLWQRQRGPALLLFTGLSLSFILGLFGHNANYPFTVGSISLPGAGKPHISGEILRLAGCIAIAWVIYRNAEWNAPLSRLWQSSKRLILILGLCGFGLVVSGDMGPLLILSLLSLILIVVPAIHAINPSTPLKTMVTIAMACLLTIGCIELWRTSITDWAPLFSRTAAERELARQEPFSARSPNLAQIRWLIDATPHPEGFGLAKVPYCGAYAMIGAQPCTLSSGAPIQLPSDFAFAGVAATWGVPYAAALLLCLLCWLCILPLAALSSIRKSPASPPWSLLHVWLIAIPCLGAQAQTAISVGGTLTWSPLSGVTLPLLGYGATSLCIAAVWVGLASNSLNNHQKAATANSR